jgi:hypothetical protein
MTRLNVGPWEGGDPQGYILVKPGYCRLSIPQSLRETGLFRPLSFSAAQYGGIKAAHSAAVTWRDAISMDLGLTRNQYRTVRDNVTNEEWLEMALTQGKTMFFSKADLERVRTLTWCTLQGRFSCYASGTITETRKRVTLHRFLNPDWLVVDHIDGDGLNNQRENLRCVTMMENSHNQHRQYVSATGAVGVFRFEQTYTASLMCDGVNHVKRFKILKYGEEEAFRLAVEARLEMEEQYGFAVRSRVYRRYGSHDTETDRKAKFPRTLCDWPLQENTHRLLTPDQPLFFSPAPPPKE